MKRLIVAAILAAAAQAAWADLPELETVEQNLAIAEKTPDFNASHNLVTTSFDGTIDNVTGGAVVAGVEGSGAEKGNLNLSASKNVPLASNVPGVNEKDSSLKNLLKNEDASASADAAVLLAILFLLTLAAAGGVGYIIGAGVGTVAGASGTVATAIKGVFAIIGVKAGFDWFMKKP